MKIGLVGDGQMGQVLKELIAVDDTALFPKTPVMDAEVLDYPEIPAVLIDFSHPNNLKKISAYALAHELPVVIATTGYSEEQIAEIHALSEKVPVLFSANFSLGVIVMNRLVKEMTHYLGQDFDIEVIEQHHNKKIDAPSGTAKMLVDTINEELHYKEVHGRSGVAPRTKQEIGIHSIRGGTIVGQHEVLFAGTDETLTLKHEAFSKKIFAKGALKGALWVTTKPAALYSMEDCLFGGK